MIWLILVLAGISAAPTAHGEGLYALIEPLIFVAVAVGVWLHIRYQARRDAEAEQDQESGDEEGRPP